MWFQIIDKNGYSFYRSWSKVTNDSLKFRKDIQNVIKNNKILTSISVGHFDITFKSMIPIFDKNKFLGIFELITHFNSIAETLEDNKIDSIVLADKRLKNKIIYPFTNMFIDDYYIANKSAKKSFIDLIKKEGLENILNIKQYKIIGNNIVSTFKIIELENNLVGYIVLSMNINDINIYDIQKFKKNSQFYVYLSIFLFALLYTIISYYIYSRSIKKLNSDLKTNLERIKTQEKKNQIILDSQKNIIVITDGFKIKNSNKQLLDFFNFDSIEKFKNKYQCICDTFIDMDDEHYIIDKDYNGKNWAEHILSSPNIKFKAAIKKDNLIHHFTLNVNSTIFDKEDKPYIIVTLTDITHEIEQQKSLKILNENLEDLVEKKTKELKDLNESLEKRVFEESEKNKQKDRMLFQQNKMAAMGEMLSNMHINGDNHYHLLQ